MNDATARRRTAASRRREGCGEGPELHQRPISGSGRPNARAILASATPKTATPTILRTQISVAAATSAGSAKRLALRVEPPMNAAQEAHHHTQRQHKRFTKARIAIRATGSSPMAVADCRQRQMRRSAPVRERGAQGVRRSTERSSRDSLRRLTFTRVLRIDRRDRAGRNDVTRRARVQGGQRRTPNCARRYRQEREEGDRHDAPQEAAQKLLRPWIACRIG